MFNLELLWRVAKGAVSAATYRTAVSLLWPLPLSSGIIIAVLRPKPPGSLWGGASGEEPPGSLRESLGKIPAPGGLREPPGSFRDPPGSGASGPDRVARISRPPNFLGPPALPPTPEIKIPKRQIKCLERKCKARILLGEPAGTKL